MNQLGHALTALDGPRVHALYVYSSNPAVVAPDQNAVLAGLAREDLFTAVHERFLTDTACFADVVLPATTSLEHADLYRSYGQYNIQRTRPLIPPCGEARSNWDVFRSLGQAMGVTDPLFRKSADELVDLLLSRPAPLRDGIDTAALGAGLAVPLRLPAGAKTRFRTPSGKIEILNPRLADPLPRFRSTHVDREARAPGARPPLPLRLMTAPQLYGLNSTFMQERDELRARAGPMALLASPQDAGARGLSDGQLVEAWNERGAVAFTLRITDAVPRGVVVAPGVRRLADAPGRGGVNVLTSQRLSDEGAGSTFYDNAVDLRPAS
jgi:anaerobic selenocysteine-containing dehydrogenase